LLWFLCVGKRNIRGSPMIPGIEIGSEIHGNKVQHTLFNRLSCSGMI
jgi:hypothetical protein